MPIAGLLLLATDALAGLPLAKASITLASITLNETSVNSDAEDTSRSAIPNPERTGSKASATAICKRQVNGSPWKPARLLLIAGTIRDADGEPLVHISVGVSRLRYENGRRKISGEAGANTDDLGQYRIAGLPPGQYYVRAENQNNKVGTLYPGVQDSSAARVVSLSAGDRITGIDITLPNFKTVRVSERAIIPQGTRLSGVVLQAGNGTEADFSLMSEHKEDGTFTFKAVPPGVYSLTAEATVPPKPTTDFWDLSGVEPSVRGCS